MPRFTQMMDVIFGLIGWDDFPNEINDMNREIEDNNLQDQYAINHSSKSIIE